MQKYQFSDFRILKQLGQGGFGSAYLALRNSDEQPVCLKFIPGYGSSPQTAIAEAKVLSQLDDINVIKYYGSFGVDDQFCIVMEYAPGGSLYDVIDVGYLFLFYRS